jgi:HK97 family phage portal protein
MTTKDRLLALPVMMGLVSKSVAGEWYLRNGFPRLAAGYGAGQATHTGKSIDEQSALTCATVWACTRVISETVAGLPLHLMSKGPEGKKIADAHPLDWVLYAEPNTEMDAMHLREVMTAHCLTWGNAYARKVKRGGTNQTIALWPWLPNETRGARKTDGALVYYHRERDGTETEHPASDVFHMAGLGFDGLQGYSVISMARQSIALSLTQEEYAAKFFAHGGRRSYLLEHPGNFRTDTQKQEFMQSWAEKYGNIDTAHAPVILTGGTKYVELGFSPVDAQFLEARQFSVPEVCRWFRISPHMVGDLSRATFSNIEHLAIEFVQQTLMSWLLRWEHAINRQLLGEGEKGRYYAKHNVSALLRGDFASRTAGYASALQNGWLNRDEVRDLEDANAIPDKAGQQYTVQLNMQELPIKPKPAPVAPVAAPKPTQEAQPNEEPQ